MVALAMVSGATVAAADDAGGVIKARHEHFKQVGTAMKGLMDELKSSSPAIVQVRLYAKRLDDLAPQVPSWFPAGSGPESGQKTHAKAAVWEKPEEFKKDAEAFALEAHKLDQVAANGDLNAISAQAQAVGKACKTCHQTFREKED